MKIPTPSFFKIRIVALAICFLALCFFVGMLKNAIAGDTWGTADERWFEITINNSGVAASNRIVKTGCQLNYENGYISCTDYKLGGAFETYNISPYFCNTLGEKKRYKYNLNSLLIAAGTLQEQNVGRKCAGNCLAEKEQRYIECEAQGFTLDEANWNDETCSGPCLDPCNDQKEALIEQCGGQNYVDWTTWDGTTCNGECVCADEKAAKIAECEADGLEFDEASWNNDTCTGSCDDPCQEEKDYYQELCNGTNNVDWDKWDQETCSGPCKPCDYGEYLKSRDKCPSPSMHVWNEFTCTGYCQGNVNCTDDEVAAAIQDCGGQGIKYMDSTDPDCPYECNRNCMDTYEHAQLVCGYHGVGAFNWETCEYSCDECPQNRDECREHCQERGGIKHIDCAMLTNGTAVTTCVCNADVEQPGEGVPEEEESDAPPDEETTDPDEENPDDPNEAELNAINENLKSLVNQGNTQKDQLHEITNKADWIGKNAKTIADNTAKTVEAIDGLELEGGLDDSDKALLGSIKGSVDGIGNDLEDIAGSVDGVEDGVGEIEGTLEEVSEGEYGGGIKDDPYEAQNHNFADRTEEFLSDMRSTGIFSLPDQLSSSIPGGGSPTIAIDGGETYGSHTIDFSDYSPAILILRSIVQIAGMIIAIRIVTLKR